jgi:hypothetical protein
MCQPGNQAIYSDCRSRILKRLKKKHARNWEMRAVLIEHGGCMVNDRVDKKPEPVVIM